MGIWVHQFSTVWLEKSWGPSKPPHHHSQAVRGPMGSILDAVVATSGPGIESGISGPLRLSSWPLIKPESLLGPQGRSKFWFLPVSQEGGR